MKHLYYYVPPCPVCGSRMTGRYVLQPRAAADARYVELESLKHGELVRFVFEIPKNNAYCEECGHEWHENVEAKFYDKTFINEEIQARGTMSRYAAFVQENPKRRSLIGRIFGLFS